MEVTVAVAVTVAVRAGVAVSGVCGWRRSDSRGVFFGAAPVTVAPAAADCHARPKAALSAGAVAVALPVIAAVSVAVVPQ